MHRTIIILTMLVLSGLTSSAQTKTSTNTSRIKAQAQAMGQYLVKKDFKALAKTTYPGVVEMMGGEESMIGTMAQMNKAVEADGFSYSSVTIGEPSEMITEGKELQCTVPETLEMKATDGKRMIVKSTLIALSTDNGKTWYFIDTAGKDMETLKSALPNLSAKLVVPEPPQPAYLNN